MPTQSSRQKTGRKPVPVKFGGKTYFGGIPELSEKYGIHPEKIRSRRKKGWTWEEALGIRTRTVITGRRSSPVRIGGVTYNRGIPELSEKFGLSQSLIRSRRKMGWSWEESLGIKPRKKHRSDAVLLTIDGETYDASEAARVFGVPGNQPGGTVRNRKRSGWTDRQAVGLDPPPQYQIKKKRQRVHNKSYPIPDRTGTVYLITNKINGKQYVGITASSFKHRKLQYKSDAKGSQANRPIINAMRRYGFKNFKFEVLDQSAKTYPELLALEEQYISKYDTYNSGYNASTGGETGGKSITIDGVEYPNMAIAALTHNIEPGTLRYRINKAGMSAEEAVNYENQIQYQLLDPKKGKVRGSLTDLCRMYKVPYSRSYQRLAKGWSIEEVLGLAEHGHTTVNEPVKVGTKKFPSFRAACDEYGVNYKLAWRRHNKRNWTIEQALGISQPPKTAKHGGQKVRVGKRSFNSKAAAMKALGISYEKLSKRIADGTYEIVEAP